MKLIINILFYLVATTVTINFLSGIPDVWSLTKQRMNNKVLLTQCKHWKVQELTGFITYICLYPVILLIAYIFKEFLIMFIS
jgi:hypothetical protein